MITRTLLSGLLSLGMVATAGADTDIGAAETGYTMEDVTASPAVWRAVDPENLIVFETTKGEIVLELLPEVAPKHAVHFRYYVREGLYTETAFHRVIKGFMAQGGDVEAKYGPDVMLEPTPAEFTLRRAADELPLTPVGRAEGAIAGLYKGFPIQTEQQFLADPLWSADGKIDSWIPHCVGVLSSARLGEQPGLSRLEAENSANAQFFLISGRGRHLDRNYTAKGRVLKGLDVVQSIKLGPPNDGFPIANPDILQRAYIVADMPADLRRQAFVQRTDTPEWQAVLEAAYEDETDICDVPRVPAVVE
ncbi:MAG: peptidylprolyl isomerase [Pseudomonadota bacterium]